MWTGEWKATFIYRRVRSYGIQRSFFPSFCSELEEMEIWQRRSEQHVGGIGMYLNTLEYSLQLFQICQNLGGFRKALRMRRMSDSNVVLAAPHPYVLLGIGVVLRGGFRKALRMRRMSDSTVVLAAPHPYGN
ncbi:hypothetical protein Tco_0728292 [Tanacetum coccineum]|uniref:Uncharacterized protein n=1 Tax=Tanacetum coccineum TaxID=301880 RepID=A0ABQ4YLR6_9ASTR